MHDVTFTAAPGRVVGLLGPNGAGKTTTLHVLLGLAAATAGTATFDGRAFADLTHPARTVGALLDAGGLHPGGRGATTCACSPPPAGSRRGASTRCSRSSA